MSWNLGLKVWSNNRNYIEEIRRLCTEHWCDYVELYAVPDTFNELAMLWKAIEIPFVIHAPHYRSGMNLADRDCAETNRRLAEQSFAFADLLNADKVIFHPGVMGQESETIHQINLFPPEWKRRILIENKPYQATDSTDIICNGNSPDSIKRILHETGIGFCFDIGHCVCSANSRKVAPFQDIAAFEQLNPAMYHLSDNDFASPIDGHKHLGYGNFPFAKIFSLIDTVKPISIETEKWYQDSLKDFEDDVRFLKKELYEFHISLATLEDMQSVYELANDPTVRANSLSNEPIPWQTHQDWYQKKISDANVRFYLARDTENNVCAYVRYDFNKEKKWYVSVAVSSRCRGRSLGTWAMKRTENLLRLYSNYPFTSLVMADNIASIKMAQGAGYRQTGEIGRGEDRQLVLEKEVSH